MFRQINFRHKGKPAFFISLIVNPDTCKYNLESNLPIILIPEIYKHLLDNKNKGIEYSPANFEEHAEALSLQIQKSEKAKNFFFTDIFIGKENQLDYSKVDELWTIHDRILNEHIKYLTNQSEPIVCFYLKFVMNLGRLSLNKYIKYDEIERSKFEEYLSNEQERQSYVEQFNNCVTFVKVLSDMDKRPSFIGAINQERDVLIGYII